MAKINLKIPQGYRRFFYLTLGLSWLSGVSFWLLRRYGFVEGDFGPEAHFLQFPLLQIHGFAAFTMLLCLGAIFSAHVPSTWPGKRAKKSGVILVSTVTLSILSAYSLYYLVSEEWHDILADGHAILGLLLPLVLIIHIKIARKSRNKKNALNYS